MNESDEKDACAGVELDNKQVQEIIKFKTLKSEVPDFRRKVHYRQDKTN